MFHIIIIIMKNNSGPYRCSGTKEAMGTNHEVNAPKSFLDDDGAALVR